MKSWVAIIRAVSLSIVLSIISFGSKKAPYAIKWHERRAEFRHGRKRRYLADPFNRLARSRLAANIRARMRAHF